MVLKYPSNRPKVAGSADFRAPAPAPTPVRGLPPGLRLDDFYQRKPKRPKLPPQRPGDKPGYVDPKRVKERRIRRTLKPDVDPRQLERFRRFERAAQQFGRNVARVGRAGTPAGRLWDAFDLGQELGRAARREYDKRRAPAQPDWYPFTIPGEGGSGEQPSIDDLREAGFVIFERGKPLTPAGTLLLASGDVGEWQGDLRIWTTTTNSASMDFHEHLDVRPSQHYEVDWSDFYNGFDYRYIAGEETAVIVSSEDWPDSVGRQGFLSRWDGYGIKDWTGDGPWPWADGAPVQRVGPLLDFPDAEPARKGTPLTQPSTPDPWRWLDPAPVQLDVGAMPYPLIAWPWDETLTEVQPQPVEQVVVVPAEPGAPVVPGEVPPGRPIRPRNEPVRDPNTKERKIRMGAVQAGLWAMANVVSEGVDFVEAMYKSLPKQYKSRKHRTPQAKALAVWDAWDDDRFDVASAFAEYVNNQVGDWFWGRISVDKQVNQLLNKPTGGGRFATEISDLSYEATGEGPPLPTLHYDRVTGEWWIDVLGEEIHFYRPGRS